MEVLNEKLYSIQMEEKFYIIIQINEHTNYGSFTYKWEVLQYKWDTNDTLSIAWWIFAILEPQQFLCHRPRMYYFFMKMLL